MERGPSRGQERRPRHDDPPYVVARRAARPGLDADSLNAVAPRLSLAQVGGLTGDAKARPSADNVTALSPAQVGKLSASGLAGLGATNLSTMSPDNVAAVTAAQLGDMTATQVDSFGKDQLARMIGKQVASLQAWVLNERASDTLGALLSNLSNSQVSGLTAATVQGRGSDGFAGGCHDGQRLRGGGRRHDGRARRRTRLGAVEERGVPAERDAVRRPDRSDGANAGNISKAAVAGISSADIASLTPTQAHAFGNVQVGAMTSGQIEALYQRF